MKGEWTAVQLLKRRLSAWMASCASTLPIRCAYSTLHVTDLLTLRQAFFRETDLPPQLCALLAFPPHLALHEAAPQEFALQFWDPQKTANADRVVALMGMLIHNNSTSPQELTFARCLLELSLASNAPTTLKTHALRLIPARLAIPLPQLALTPYVPVPGTNGEEWDRLEPASALDALVEMVLAGEYGGVDGDAGPGSSARRKDKLELRAAAAGVFEVRCSR